jgi:hypothetical protein
VTFKDLRKIIEESQKFDDKEARLKLWPAGNGNGDGHNNNRFWEWKGRPIISSEHWKKLAGYQDMYDVLTPEEREYWKKDLNFPSNEKYDEIEKRIIREIDPKALQYFPNDKITVVFNSSYSCPKAPDIYKMWISEYRELLTARGYRHHEYDGSWED